MCDIPPEDTHDLFNIVIYSSDYETAFAPLNVEIEPGNMFDEQYTLHEEVGKGRFGIVYRVTEKASGTRRAAKIIKCIKAKDKEKVQAETTSRSQYAHL